MHPGAGLGRKRIVGPPSAAFIDEVHIPGESRYLQPPLIRLSHCFFPVPIMSRTGIGALGGRFKRVASMIREQSRKPDEVHSKAL